MTAMAQPIAVRRLEDGLAFKDMREPHWEWSDPRPSYAYVLSSPEAFEGHIAIARCFTARMLTGGKAAYPSLGVLLDKARIPCVGIGGVYTRPEYRGRGYATRLLTEVLDGIKASGYWAAVLYAGNGALYERLGFKLLSDDLYVKAFDDLTFSPSDWRVEGGRF